MSVAAPEQGVLVAKLLSATRLLLRYGRPTATARYRPDSVAVVVVSRCRVKGLVPGKSSKVRTWTGMLSALARADVGLVCLPQPPWAPSLAWPRVSALRPARLRKIRSTTLRAGALPASSWAPEVSSGGRRAAGALLFTRDGHDGAGEARDAADLSRAPPSETLSRRVALARDLSCRSHVKWHRGDDGRRPFRGPPWCAGPSLQMVTSR